MAVRDYLVGKMRINYDKGGGFDEYYPLDSTDFQVGKAKLEEGCNYRAAILAGGMYIAYASCSRSDILRDSVAAITYNRRGTLQQVTGGTAPVNETVLEKVNHLNDAMLWCFDTGTGKASNRWFRGLRDSWIADSEVVFGSSVYNRPGGGWVVPTLPTTGATKLQLLEAFLKWFAKNCYFPKKGTVGAVVGPPAIAAHPGAELLSYTRILYCKAGTRDTGRGYSTNKARRKARI